MPRTGKRGPYRTGFDKERARLKMREKVWARMDSLIDAQISHAEGLRYLVVRDKQTGKFLRVTETMAKAKLGQNEEIIEVWEKDPSVQAFTDLMNRTIDKPAEQVTADVTANVVYRWKDQE